MGMQARQYTTFSVNLKEIGLEITAQGPDLDGQKVILV